jgi:hypothetical protein
MPLVWIASTSMLASTNKIDTALLGAIRIRIQQELLVILIQYSLQFLIVMQYFVQVWYNEKALLCRA